MPRAVSNAQALIRTGHQANGALLLAAAVVLTLRACRHLRPGASELDGPTTAPVAELEVVA